MGGLFRDKGNYTEAGDDADMHIAAEKGDAELAELILLEKGMTVIDMEDKYGNTPLHIASAAGKADMVHFLIENGADINRKDNNGNTPLGLAIRKDHARTIDVLRRHRAKE